jgi:hypothetical protein
MAVIGHLEEAYMSAAMMSSHMEAIKSDNLEKALGPALPGMSLLGNRLGYQVLPSRHQTSG